jgi:hypothetical protein
MGQGRFEKRVAVLMPSAGRIVQLSPDFQDIRPCGRPIPVRHELIVTVERGPGTADR